MSLLQRLTLSYPGWEADKAEVELTYTQYESSHVFKAKLTGMRNKQRLFQGDRSHRQIVALDTAEFNYPGWTDDKLKAEQAHTCTGSLPKDFESVLNEMTRKQAMHSARSSVPLLRELDNCTFTYNGWEADKAEAERRYTKYERSHVFKAKLTGMRNKQRLFQGDRSHRQIVALDTAEFNYPGWTDDKLKAEQVHTCTGFSFLVDFERFNEMTRKQAMHSARSSVPLLRALDSCTFTYNGWEADKAEAERRYTQFDSSHLFKAKLTGMRNKQRLFQGDRSHRQIVALDTAEFNYPGWTDDKLKAEKAHTCTGGVDFECKFNEMTRKQAMHSARSSVPLLRELDSILPTLPDAIIGEQGVTEQEDSQEQLASQTQSSTTTDEDEPSAGPRGREDPPPPARTVLETASSSDEQDRRSSSTLEGTNREEDATTCVVCYELERTHAYIPCGHLCVCANCASQLVSVAGRHIELKCPICRVEAICVTRIFQ